MKPNTIIRGPLTLSLTETNNPSSMHSADPVDGVIVLVQIKVLDVE